MSHQSSTRRACMAAVVTLLVTVPLLAQPRGRGPGSPRYDISTEGTVTGMVASVEQIAKPGGGRRSLGGTHLALKTSTETLEVHLGPTAYLTEQNVTIAEGDTLEVVGSRITVDTEPVFLAKSVKKGDKVWTLRDPSGLPLWRGGPQ